MNDNSRKVLYSDENIYIIHGNFMYIFNTKNNKVKKKFFNEEMINFKGSKKFSNLELLKNNKLINVETGKVKEYNNAKSIYIDRLKLKNKCDTQNNIFLFNDKIHVLTKQTISLFDDTSKIVKIGDSFIPFDILFNRCKMIQLMFSDLHNEQFNELPYNDLFKNVDRYIDYIKTGKIDKVYELFQIMNYLEDIDVEHIANYIANGEIKDNDKVYEELELLYKSPFTLQFIYLANKILDNNPCGEIIENLEGKSCFNYLLKYNLTKSNKIKEQVF